jgi:hypothetical protein
MLGRIRRIDREQRKLLFSLCTNFLTRVPGVIGLLWFLPLLHSSLGTDGYAELLSAMALGVALAFLAGGFNLMGRRLIGQSYAVGNKGGEADGLVSTLAANTLAVSVTLAVISAYCCFRGAGIEFLIVSAIVALSLFLAMFDDARVAYNEHYVTALLFIALQSVSYGIGFLVPATRHNIVAGALVMQGPYILASLCTGALLLYERPYLLKGEPVALWFVLRQGAPLAVADGFVLATLSFSVVWLDSLGTTSTSAWFATTVRLFQTFLVPIMLLLTPLSSYIRIFWSRKSTAQRNTVSRATLLTGFAYGALVAVSLFVVSKLYVGRLLDLPIPEGGRWIFVLFGVIIAYKCYSSIAYVVLDDNDHLSGWTTAVAGAALTVGVIASLAVGPLGAINIYAVVAGIGMTAVLIWSAARITSPASKLVSWPLAPGQRKQLP